MATLVRKRLRVQGRVQGVGFRPFVYRLARDCRLTGLVRNDSAGVMIEVQGTAAAWDQFTDALKHRAPPLARITDIQIDSLDPDQHECAFAIQATDGRALPIAEMLPDIALCPECLADMRDPNNRRHRYGLINCTHCGPRYSIIRNIPYDRPNTTMSAFAMCPDCQKEYDSPLDRRFHAQPTACDACGPRVWLADASGQEKTGDAYFGAAEMLRAGGILAIKGIGGFHLAARADNAAAIARLRQVKHRNAKPFALMARDLPTAEQLVYLSESGRTQLTSPAAPIVLARRRPDAAVADAVAPSSHRLGIMLPYTPMQHLLFDAAPDLSCLVMTSGNVSDEPLAITNEDALARLGGMCDAFLLHNRPIERCVDDSVVMDLGDTGDILPVRVARGRAPLVVRLTTPPTEGLAVGGELKGTISLVRGQSLTLSQHLGDLKHPLAFAAFQQSVQDLLRLLALKPKWIAHDLHPAYLSTVYARTLAKQSNVPLIGVQHHHAHAASLLAEHQMTGPVLALVCDGVGFGTDGTSWGCELLAADLINFTRIGRMRPLQLPGGDSAARDIRRCALAALQLAFGRDWSTLPVCQKLYPSSDELAFMRHMMDRNVQIAPSSALGRLFDSVASLLGICSANTYEAQAAMKLESCAWQWLGEQTDDLACGDFAVETSIVRTSELIELDPGPIIRHSMSGVESGLPAGKLAADFHGQLAAALEQLVVSGAEKTGLTTVGLTGGVFMNELLTLLLKVRLLRRGLKVMTHQELPPNDGGISVGQAAVASARVAAEPIHI